MKIQTETPYLLDHSKKMKISMLAETKFQVEHGLALTSRQVLWPFSPIMIFLNTDMANQEVNLSITSYPQILLSKKIVLKPFTRR